MKKIWGKEQCNRVIIITFLLISVFSTSSFGADKSKITAVNIKREYSRMIGQIDASTVIYKIKNKNCTLSAEPLYDPAQIGVGESMNLRITLEAATGFDFSWLKISSCTSDVGEVTNLTLSADKRKATLMFTADPLPVQLEWPRGLKWEGDTGRWEKVEYADSYEVKVYEILPSGKLSTEIITVKTKELKADLREGIHKRPGDFVFAVQAIADKKKSYINASNRAILDYDKSQIVKENAVGYYGGNWQVSKGIKKYALNRKDREDVDSKYLNAGRYLIEGEVYCFDDDGAVLTGWQKYDEMWSYHNSGGKGGRGWIKRKGSTYYLDPDTGIMATGWITLLEKRYYFTENGDMVTGWHKILDDIYYFKKDGSVQTKRMIDKKGKAYDFREDGRLIRS